MIGETLSFATTIGTWMVDMGLRLSPSRDLGGIRVVASVSDSPGPEVVFAKVRSALQVIRTAQPRRISQLERHCSVIWVRRHAASRALYDGTRRACILDSAFVGNPLTKPAAVAASIVHEATHARIDRWRIPYDDVRRARIERLCRQEELDFGIHLPEGQDVIERARTLLALDDSAIARSPQQWREARREAIQAELAELPLPRLVKAWLGRVARKRAV